MTRDRHHEAVAYLHGDLDPAGVQSLAKALAEDSAFRSEFVALARLHGHLGEIGKRAALGLVDSARMLAVHSPEAHAPTTRIIRRRQRFWAGWAAAAAALLAVGLGILALGIVSIRTRPLVPTVVAAEGCLVRDLDGHERPASAGTRLRAGDRLITSATSAPVTVTLQGGRFILSPGGMVEITASEPLKSHVRLMSGAVEADLTSADSALYLLVHDNALCISNAQATVRLAPGSASAVVSRGSIAVISPTAPTTEIPAGQNLELPAPRMDASL